MNALTIVVRRLIQGLLTVFGIVTVSFFLVTSIPGDPVEILAGTSGATPEYYAMMRGKLGLDRPIGVRYVGYVVELARGNLGYSLVSHEPVSGLIVNRLPATLLLGVSSLVLAAIFGVLVGTLQARFAGGTLDRIGQVVSVAGYSMPLFWLGQIALLLLALHARWFPVGGMSDPREPAHGLAAVLDVARHAILPTLTLATYNIAIIARLARSRLIEVFREDYIRTAHAKGLAPRRVVLLHALRNGLLPVVTVVGMSVGFLLASSLVIETVFAWPGAGRLMYDSLLARDYPVLLGNFVVLSSMVVAANIAADLALVWLDPRIRL